jgi:hypothetical protein
MIALLFVLAVSAAQPWMENLLVNANASEGARGWTTEGDVGTEELGGASCFTVRRGGSFAQDVELPEGAVGQFAVLIGRGRADRVIPDGTITGLPYLYAVVLTRDRQRFLDYWQGQDLLARPTRPDEWVRMSGVYKVPEHAAYVSVQLRQAEASGTPHDGSAARFTEIRFHLFPTEAAARAYATHFQTPR